MLEASTLREHTGAEPVLLLDDPFAELDIRRSGKILALLEERGVGQTILVVPRESDIPSGLKRLQRMSIHRGALSA
jgi:recombinational DNA repair ATPase RecF